MTIRNIDTIEKKSVYDYDFRTNVSFAYKMTKALSIQLFMQNILGKSENKRYSFDTGNNRAAPRRVRYVEEPRTFGLQLEYSF